MEIQLCKEGKKNIGRMISSRQSSVWSHFKINHSPVAFFIVKKNIFYRLKKYFIYICLFKNRVCIFSLPYGTHRRPSPAPACMILTRTYLLVFFPSHSLFLVPLSSLLLLPLKEHWLISPSTQGITVYWDIPVLIRKN